MKGFVLQSQDMSLLGILNSNVAWWYLSQTCAVLGDINRGGRLQLKTQYVSQLPIATPSPTHRADIESLVQKCLDAKGQGVEQWEAEINRLVYEVYDLTAKEIAIVESSTTRSAV
jgi:hypothetical protein